MALSGLWSKFHNCRKNKKAVQMILWPPLFICPHLFLFPTDYSSGLLYILPQSIHRNKVPLTGALLWLANMHYEALFPDSTTSLSQTDGNLRPPTAYCLRRSAYCDGPIIPYHFLWEYMQSSGICNGRNKKGQVNPGTA